MQVSFLNEGVMALHSGLSSAYFPSPSEEMWMEKKQEFENEQEPCSTTQSVDKHANAEVLESVIGSCNGKKKSFESPICLKLFGVPSKLKRHYLIHTDQKPFQCSICCHGFSERSNLKVHMRTHNNLVQWRTPSLQSHRYSFVPSNQTSKSRLKNLVCNGRTVRSSKHPTLQSDANSTDQQKSAIIDLVETNLGVEMCKNVSERDVNIIKGHWCPLCSKCFKAPSKLKRHILIHTGQKPFKCSACSKAFRQRSHLKAHKCKEDFKPKCNSILSDWWVGENTVMQNGVEGVINALVDASIDIQGRSPDIEKIIPPEASSSHLISSELKSSTREIESVYTLKVQTASSDPAYHKRKGVNQCSICLKNFPYPSKLSRHLLSHTDFKPFQCNVCSKSFRYLCHLQSHQMIHKKRIHPVSKTSELIGTCQPKTKSGYQCEICLKTFSFPSKLTRHRFVHLDAKPHTCTICQKSFRQASYLDKHLKLHTRNRNNLSGVPGVPQKHRTKCSTSGALGGSNNCRPDVSSPQKLDSADNQTYNVLECNNNLKQNVRLTASKSGTVEIEMVDCLKDAEVQTAIYIPETLEHKRKGINQCSICLKNFPYPSKLSRHLLSHTDFKPFQCNVCSKSFRYLCHLQSHEMIHKKTAKKRIHPVSKTSELTGTCQPKTKSGYQCNICLKTFSFPSKLTRHRFVHLDAKPHTCTICQKSFRQASYLDKHLKLHTRKRNNPSELPGVPQKHRATFSTPKALGGTNNCRPDVSSPQKLDSADNQTYEVLECNNKINQNVPLTRSKSSTVEIEMIDCLKDAEVQTATYSLVNLKHKRGGVNQCSICLKNFPYPSKLSRHLLSHTDFKQFKCNVCSKLFQHLYHLQSHQMIHKKKGEDIIAGDLEKVHANSFDNTVKFEDKDVHISSQDGAEDSHQDQNMVTDNMLSQKLNSDCSDSGRFFSNTTSLLENVAIKSEFVFQSSNKSVWGLTHNTDTVLVEEKASDIMPLGRVSDCPPKTDSSLQHCVSKSRSGEYWTRHMGDIDEDCSLVGPDPFRDPNVREIVVVGHQDPCERLTKPPCDFPICPDCSQCFTTINELYAHKCANRYPEEKIKKSHQCDICFKLFNAPSKLKRHCVTHTGQRPFQCTQCQRTFTQSHHLKTHMLSHR